jgi:hypothetical protein
MRKKLSREQRRNRQLHLENLEARRYLTSVGWDGPGLGSAELSYFVGDVPASVGIEQGQFQSAIEQALNAWSSVADITFSQTNVPNQNDSIEVRFKPLDGRGGTLAQAYFPDDVNRRAIAGDIELDSSERWEIGNQLGNAAFDLARVLAHEVGHALGLDHLNIPNSVLFSGVSPGQSFTGLSTADAEAALRLYAPATTSPPADETPADSGTDGQVPTEEGGSTEESPTTRRLPWRRFGFFGRRSRLGSDSMNSDSTPGIGQMGPHEEIPHADEEMASDDSDDALEDESVAESESGEAEDSPTGDTTVDVTVNEAAPADDDTTDDVIDDETDDTADDETDDVTIDDGGLGAGEATPAENPINTRSRAIRERVFARLDADSSGTITQDEVRDRIWQRLGSVDTDGDEAITLDELLNAESGTVHGPGVHFHGEIVLAQAFRGRRAAFRRR